MTYPDTDRLVIRAGSGGEVQSITPASAGWAFSGLRVVDLAPGESITWELDGEESLLVPLRGSADLAVDHPDQGPGTVTLTGRDDVFSGPTDVAYLPVGSRTTATSPSGGRLALATSRASSVLARRWLPADAARVELRGAGAASRRVTNYTLGSPGVVEHLLVCEVITPGGNTSSYPPHKHDVHSDVERELEEIYYFEVSDGPAGPDGAPVPGLGYHRTYGTPERPIEVLAQVRSGDVALVPHGYHGPCSVPPDFDLYYLNVMAGPATDRTWLATDDPALAWVRDSWESTPIDPRLLPATPEER